MKLELCSFNNFNTWETEEFFAACDELSLSGEACSGKKYLQIRRVLKLIQVQVFLGSNCMEGQQKIDFGISDPEGPNAAGRHWNRHWNLVTRTKKRRRRWAGGIKRRRAFCWWKNPNCYKFFLKKIEKTHEVISIWSFSHLNIHPIGELKKRFPHLELKSYGKHWTTKRLSQTSFTNNY